MDRDSGAESFLSKFDIKGKPVYAKILWQNSKDHLFQIQVFADEQSWAGDFSNGMCSSFGHNFDENDEQYSNSVKDALKMKNDMYTYDFTHNESDNKIGTFYWKRKFVDTTATFVHGFVTVKKDENGKTKNDILDFLITENKNLCLTIEDYKNKIEILKNDLETWKNEFEKFVDMKNLLETRLYGKFMQLLNTKKRRIQELEQHLNDL